MVSQSDSAAIIGAIVADVVRRAAASDPAGAMLRVRGFEQNEIVAAIGALGEWRPHPGQNVRLVAIARRPIEGVPSSYLLPPHSSATTIRNNAAPNDTIVFFEVEPHSDQQSLGKVTTIDDRSVLSEPSRFQLVLDHAWRRTAQRGLELPRALQHALGDVHEALVEARTEVSGGANAELPLREWVPYVIAVTQAVAAYARAVEDGEVTDCVAKMLPVLGLFEDPELKATRTRHERKRRLRRNAWYADGRDRHGNEAEPDDIAQAAERTRFQRPDGSPCSEAETSTVRLAIQARAYSRHTSTRVLFSYWDQLFEPKSRRRGLGDRIRDLLAEKFPERLAELSPEDVNGLNAGEQQAARSIMEPPDAASDGSDGSEQRPSLYELCDPALARAIDKVAHPSARVVTDPLRDLVREIYAMISDLDGGTEDADDAARTILLDWDEQSGVDSRRSAALFAFLYGASLRQVVEGQRLVYGLEVSHELLSSEGTFAPGPSEEVGAEEFEWAPLRLTLRWKSDPRPDRTLEWKPGDDFSAPCLARLLHTGDVAWWSTVDMRFEQWTEAAAKGKEQPPGGTREQDISALGPTSLWLERRREAFREIAARGIDSAGLHRYVDEFAQILGRAFTDLVPRGEPLEELDAFLRMDTFRSSQHGGELVLLGTHPMKLRWFAHHLQRMTQLLGAILDRTCDLSKVNDAYYFEQLALLSAHDQPPILAHNESLYLAVREIGLHEVFAKVKEAGRDVRDWLSDVDDESIDELANVVDTYVDAYPHAADGLALCIVLQKGGAALLTRLVRRIRSRISRRIPDLCLRLHVVAPRSSFPDLDEALAEFDSPEERQFGDFPRLAVTLSHWDNAHLPDTEILGAADKQYDLAIIPNLFGAYTRSHDNTRLLSSITGNSFQPWLDKPTVLRPAEDGRAHAARELLPERRDDLLEWWSTLCVRQFRGKSVGEVGPDTVDFLALQVSLESGSEFFRSIHRKSRWVATLDEFIGRDQIEALSSRPDIITVRPRIGSAETYTLIVSSHEGEEYVVDRISRRLRAYVPALADRAADTARELFERARVLSPGILLRASGLGRSSQELVGLAVTRWVTARQFPVDWEDRAFEAWISLDEHQDWFGGRRALRADLLRIAGTWKEDRLHVKSWVVEAKLRDGWMTEHADRQVDNTIELFAHALKPECDDGVTDGEFWRRAIIEAIDQSSKQLVTKRGELRSEFPAVVAWDSGRATPRLPVAVREAWIEGDYVLDGIEGIVCTVVPTDSHPPDPKRTPSGHHWLKLARTDLLTALREMADPSVKSSSAEDGGDNTRPKRVTGSGTNGPYPSHHPCSVSSVSTEHTARAEHDRGPAPLSQGAHAAQPDTARLERRYQVVLDAFSDHRVQVHRPSDDPYYEGPGFYVFRVVPGAGVGTDKVKRMTEELKLKLGLPAEDQPRAYVDRGAVVFEVPKPDHERYFVRAQDLWATVQRRDDSLYTPLGVDVRGEVVGIDFSSADSPHLLVAGTTGSGKSVALETLLIGLTRYYTSSELKLLLVDPKGTELTMLEDDPHLLRPIGMDASDAIDYLEQAVTEMENRRHAFRDVRARNLAEHNRAVDASRRLPWWLVVLDEYADLTSDKEDRKEIEARLQRLSQKARASGIHVVVATQKPTVEVIGGIIRSNLPAQLALRVKTGTDSRVIMDETGAESLAGKGDAFLKTARGVARLQCAAVQR